MVKNQQIQSLPELSQLERFTLGFEFDKTIQQIKRDVRARTDKSA